MMQGSDEEEEWEVVETHTEEGELVEAAKPPTADAEEQQRPTPELEPSEEQRVELQAPASPRRKRSYLDVALGEPSPKISPTSPTRSIDAMRDMSKRLLQPGRSFSVSELHSRHS